MNPDTRLEFVNGWTIDVDWVKDGMVGYRRWPPGIENQGFLENLRCMPLQVFMESLSAHEYKNNSPA